MSRIKSGLIKFVSILLKQENNAITWIYTAILWFMFELVNVQEDVGRHLPLFGTEQLIFCYVK